MGRWVWEVSRRLSRSCEVVIYGSTDANQTTCGRWEEVRFVQVPVRADRLLLRLMGRIWRLRDPRRRAIASNLYYRFYAVRGASIFRREGCDIVHVQNFSQFVPLVRRLNQQARIVLHMHAKWLVQLDRRQVERRLANVDAIVGNSEYITNGIRQRFPDRAHQCNAVFNGVDIDVFCPASRDGLCSDDDLIVYVGRLSPEKGIHVLLEAMDKIIAVRPRARLELIGGPHVVPIDLIVAIDDDPTVRDLRRFYGKESYSEYIDRRLRGRLDNNVQRIGSLHHQELRERLRRAAVFVAPSLIETFGMPVAEAMATSLPIVASRVGALSELVENEKSGLLAAPNDPAALANAVLRLLSDRDLAQALGRAARQRAEELFSWEKAVAKLQCLYAGLLAPKGTRDGRQSYSHQRVSARAIC
jgi:glycosyltransferase involved in cell wall biosynthesis